MSGIVLRMTKLPLKRASLAIFLVCFLSYVWTWHALKTRTSNFPSSCPYLDSKSANLEWKVEENKYLLAMCYVGGASNKYICIRNYLRIAALLKRTLVIPDDLHEDNFSLAPLLDVDAMSACLGGHRLLSAKTYLNKTGSTGPISLNHMTIFGQKSLNFFKEQAPFKGVKLEKDPEVIGDFEWGVPMTHEELVRIGSSPDRLISLGDTYFFVWEPYLGLGYVRDWADWFLDLLDYEKPPKVFGLNHTSCLILLPPHPAVVRAARAFLLTFLGEVNSPFLAAHVRRGDFLGYAERGDDTGLKHKHYFPLLRIADCLVADMKRRQVETLFLATDGRDEELAFLKGVIERRSKGNVLTLPKLRRDRLPIWAKPLLEFEPYAFGQGVATVEKLLCARATVFKGTYYSTFSLHIFLLRSGYGSATCNDGLLCEIEH